MGAETNPVKDAMLPAGEQGRRLSGVRRTLFHWVSLTLLLQLFHALEHLKPTMKSWRSRSHRHLSAVSSLDPGGETFLRLTLLL